jgi:tetratricopeptide (TPR) repeat protein
MASLLAERDDEEGARWYAHEADRLDPLSGPSGGDLEHERDAALLAERYAREQRWHDLEPVIDRLVRRGGLAAERLGLSRADLHYHAGRAALELGKYDKAVHHYGEALEFEPVHLAALIERARAAAGCDRWDAAHDFYGQALLVQRSERRPARVLAETLFRMGAAREKTGLPEAAVTLYQAALDVHSSHAGALAAGCRLHRAAGDLVATERLLRAALDRLEGARRVEILIELADLRGRFFADAETAAAMCREARGLAPDERPVLLAFVEHCFAAGQAEDAIAALDQLASAEPSHLERGKYLQLAAVLAAERSVDQAVRLFHDALDCFFAPHRMPPAAMRAGCMVAFREIDRLLRGRRQWKRLEREYRAMIKRLPSDAAELPRLWADLGAIYRTHLGHGEAAIQSFEVAAALEKDRLTHHRILIDLYQGFQSDELDKLIERRKKLLAAEPFNHEHYSALRALWTKTKELDRTYTACRALVLLGRADRSEVAFFRRFRPGGVVWPRRGLTQRDWARLRHPNEDPLVSAIMGLCAEPVAMLSAMTARRMRLSDDESISYDHVRHLYRQVAGALGVGSPAVFVMPEMLGDVVLANLRRGQILTPAFAIGCHMYQGRSNAQMVQGMARALSYARPSAYLRLLLGGQTGSAKLLAAVWAAARATAVRGATQGVSLDGVASEMQAALGRRAHRGVWLAELSAALRRVRERVDVPVDLQGWARAVDATARRAGLLLSGDLKAAAADLSREPMFAQKVKRERRLADLLVHSVSDEHQEMRRELGLAVD